MHSLIYFPLFAPLFLWFSISVFQQTNRLFSGRIFLSILTLINFNRMRHRREWWLRHGDGWGKVLKCLLRYAAHGLFGTTSYEYSWIFHSSLALTACLKVVRWPPSYFRYKFIYRNFIYHSNDFINITANFSMVHRSNLFLWIFTLFCVASNAFTRFSINFYAIKKNECSNSTEKKPLWTIQLIISRFFPNTKSTRNIG